MGRLLEGKWISHDLGSDAEGRYVRRATQFRSKDVTPEVRALFIDLVLGLRVVPSNYARSSHPGIGGSNSSDNM